MASPSLSQVALQIAEERGGSAQGIARALSLFDGGATVPFVARYRQEMTEGLDEVGLREVAERARYLGELADRRKTVLEAIKSQGRLTEELAGAIARATAKQELEDLYAPYKVKRRTRGEMARQRGLEPLAEFIWKYATGREQAGGVPEQVARAFVGGERDVVDAAAALSGARDICAEQIADLAPIRSRVRAALEQGQVTAKKTTKHRGQKTKFDSYERFSEAVKRIPSHRLLAIFRGEAEGVLKANLECDSERLLQRLERNLGLRGQGAWSRQLEEAMLDSFKRLLLPSLRNELRTRLRERAEADAIQIFARNLEKLLLAPPLGEAWVLGIDPGQRTGCKCVVVDPTGQLIDTALINLVKGDADRAQAKKVLSELLSRHPITAVAVGNGTHGRETEDFVRDLLKSSSSETAVVSVNEAGASVYSASPVAREELPDQDVTIRGAVSIARRLQDPLAELVKIDPKSIGVGQYQHDVSEALLGRKLEEVVESCVNRVGVELNTASPFLLARVSGIGAKLAARIVEHRSALGKFPHRKALLKVSGLGAKTFEQAAGFLRVRGGTQPLDASGVHPERYAVVEQMAKDLSVPLGQLVGSAEAVDRIEVSRYLTADLGQYTLDHIVEELGKPGRDPRAAHVMPSFREDVREMTDLTVGMMLEGQVTNVTAFGAFVDIGVHQDGLVHISQLADGYVKDPNDVVGVGDRLKVRVLSVDLDLKRIALSARTSDS